MKYDVSGKALTGRKEYEKNIKVIEFSVSLI
jgi:hypothetical protein